MVIAVDEDGVRMAHVDRAGGGRAQVTDWAVLSRQDYDADFEKLAKDRDMQRYPCSTLLRLGEYQMLLVDAPSVARDELKSAIRWKVKDMLDYHIDDATIDVLEIPANPGTGAKNASMYAVVARNDVVRREIKQFEQAGIALTIIDIPEMAQRNIADRVANPATAAAMLFFDETGGLLTLSHGGELYGTRRLEVSSRQLLEADAERRGYYVERIATEVQRSADHFDRQYSGLQIGELLLAPHEDSANLAEELSPNFDMPVRDVGLTEIFDFAGEPPHDALAQQKLFHVLGAALRTEAVAL